MIPDFLFDKGITLKTDEFKILTDIEHILLRSSMYIGSIAKEPKKLFLNYKYTEINYVPGLFKIVNELIDNATDEFVRTSGKFANKIEIEMTPTMFSIRDNGRGIPVEKIKDTNDKIIYRPEAAWCRTKAGTNFNDDVNRTGAGMNGLGAVLSNCYSKLFEGETSDGKHHFKVVCKNNAIIQSIKVKTSTKKFTKVVIEPDFARFNVENFDDVIINLVEDRLRNLIMAFPSISIKFNGNLIKMETVKHYMEHYDPHAIVYNDKNVVLGFMSSSDGDVRFHSVVNGLILYNGGSHIDYIMNNLVSTLREGIKKKHKFDVSPAQIKSHIQLISIIRNFPDLKFDSQAKERMTNSNTEIAAHLGHIDYENIAKQILKNESIITPIIETQLAKQLLEDAKLERAAGKKLKTLKVAKHIPASSKIIGETSLFLAEGDSAIAPFISVRNGKTQGAFPLRGKIMNTYGEKPSTILSNKELSELMAILGLELGKSSKNMNYHNIVIMTDQDVDGGAIRCLLLNFFYNWPELFEQERIKILNSPRYILRGKKNSHYFYSKEELEKFKGNTKEYDLAYIKGLGSLRLSEYRDMITKPNLITVSIDDPSLFKMMYGDDPELRKQFMMNN